MIYLLKVIACTALFLLVYLFLLQKEKMFAFNRTFLLTGLLLSLVIPLMTFETSLPAEPLRNTAVEYWLPAFPAAGEVSGPALHTTGTPQKAPVPYFLLFYLLITGIMLARFIRNLLTLTRNIRNHAHIPYLDGTLVLLNQPVSPHSFLGYILVEKESYLAGHIEKEILHHEYTHGKLFHSLDILFAELLQVFCWFNPVLPFYNRAIRLNHEFQVDDRVLKHFNDARKYKYLLLSRSIYSAQIFSHSFNFIHLKKRVLMLSAKSNPLLVQLKVAMTVIFTAGTVFLFAEKTVAQKVNAVSQAVQPAAKPDIPTGKTAVEEFDRLTSKVLSHSSKGKEYQFTMAETNRLGDLYSTMTEEEKINRTLTLMPKAKELFKATPPTKEQFESFKDPKMYGVWLDGKRVPNSTLNN
ncbi:MAG: hypothetical protein LRY55_14835, partial [Leadbetterella sp.]|nr:hypothetical protein [Leadbetterella sp.]